MAARAGPRQHPLLYAGSGELVTGDDADVVVLDVTTGTELARADSGLGMQSVLFPCPADGDGFYVTAFTGVARIAVSRQRGGGPPPPGTWRAAPPAG